MKKALPEDVGADALRGPPCSAHLSGKLLISPARINHRSLPSGPLVLWQANTVRASTSVSSRCPCSPSQSIDCRTQHGLTAARGIPIGGSGRPSSTGWCRVFASPAALGKIFPRCPTSPDTGEKSSRSARRPPRPCARAVQHHLHGHLYSSTLTVHACIHLFSRGRAAHTRPRDQ